MSFVTPTFLVFLAVVLALYLPSGLRVQNAMLTVASAVFYGWEHPLWLIPLYASAGVDFIAAIWMERRVDVKGRILAASLTFNLVLLAIFKYSGFVAMNLRALGANVPIPEVVLPAGISFYTFQSMSYTIDVYRGALPACRSPSNYMLFVSFFPQLVAGPIERAPTLLAQVEAPRRVTLEAFWSGFLLALGGAAKKLIIADTVAVYVDRTFGLKEMSLPLTLAGAFAFSVQILADFSGYTDIARGVARMLGFELTPNFLHPYLAANPSEFWRRWHISFSGWIRDYLYIPLGGGKGTAARVAVVTMLTMATSGLWHGASWGFVLWGVYHGALVVLYRPIWPFLSRLPRMVTVPFFYCLTVVGWAIFRQHDAFILAKTVLNPWPTDVRATMVVSGVLGAVGAAGGAGLVAALIAERFIIPRLGWLRLPVSIGFVSSVITLLLFWTRTNADAFIYFRF